MPSVPDELFRLQIYDDGAGEYIFSAPVNKDMCAGAMVPNANPTSGAGNNAFGPFILPSPLAVCSPGLLTVTVTNTTPVPDPGFPPTGAQDCYVALVFAVPKKCRNASTAQSRLDNRGVMELS